MMDTKALAAERGSSSGPLLILDSLPPCSLMFYRAHNFLSASDTSVTSSVRVGRPGLDSGKLDCTLKHTNQHTLWAAMQRETYFMVSTLWPQISVRHDGCGREVRLHDKMGDNLYWEIIWNCDK